MELWQDDSDVTCKTPDCVAELTLEWLDAIVPHNDDACALESFEVDQRFGAESVVADVVRVHMTHSSPNCETTSVIIKFPQLTGLFGTKHRAFAGYAKEARVYGRLAEHSSLVVPALLGQYEGSNPNHILVVLEDMSPAKAGSQVKGCSVEVARGILRQIAEIHAIFWGDAELPENPEPRRFAEFVGKQHSTGWNPFTARYAGQLDQTIDAWEWMRCNLESVAAHRLGEPSTLIHGDLHLENILFTSDRKRPAVLVDWQLAGRGLGIHDVSFFLVGSLSIEDRRTHEDELLKDYFWHLTASHDIDYSLDDLFLNYRAALPRLMIRPPAAMSRAMKTDDPTQVLDFTDTIFERINAAVIDLDPVGAMKELGY